MNKEEIQELDSMVKIYLQKQKDMQFQIKILEAKIDQCGECRVQLENTITRLMEKESKSDVQD